MEEFKPFKPTKKPMLKKINPEEIERRLVQQLAFRDKDPTLVKAPFASIVAISNATSLSRKRVTDLIKVIKNTHSAGNSDTVLLSELEV